MVNLKHFTKLRARGHWNCDRGVTDIIAQLVNLEFLEFNGTFPWSNIKKLKSVVFFKSMMKDNSSFIEQQSQLKELKIEQGRGMSDSVYESENLEKLVIEEFEHNFDSDSTNIDFEKLSNLKKLKHLHLLKIERIYFDNFSSITKLNNLESLELVACGDLKIIPPLKSLKRLTLSGVYFSDLEGVLKSLGNMNNLESLSLNDCLKETLPEYFYDLKKIPNLKHLNLNKFSYFTFSKETVERLKETFSHIELVLPKNNRL